MMCKRAGFPAPWPHPARGLFNLRKRSRGQILWGASVVAKKKTRHVTPWTNEDLRQLRAYSKARTPLAEIRKTMKRTEGALRRKAGILGIGLGHRRARP